MKILYFYQYFSTPKGSWGTRVYENAKRWVAKGHEVTVVTSVFYKSDLEIRKGKWVYEMECEGIKVKVVNVLSSNKDRTFKRVKSYLSYMIVASWYAIFYPCDMVIASSGPLTVGIPGLIAKYVRRKKMIFEVRDLWPEGAIQLGVLTNKRAIRFLYWLEKRCYKAASLIVVLSPGMVSYIKKKAPKSRIITVPNASDIEMFENLIPINLPDWTEGKFIILYTGNLGETNNSRLLFRASKLLKQKNNRNIVFLLIGEGQLKEELKKLKSEENLDNFIMLDLMPKNKLLSWINRADVCIVPLADKPFIDTSSPNKLFEAFAAGKCVIQTTNGWIKDTLTSNGAGFTVSPTDEEELVECVEMLFTSPEKVKIAGESGKRLAEVQFERNTLAQKMLDEIIKVKEAKT